MLFNPSRKVQKLVGVKGEAITVLDWDFQGEVLKKDHKRIFGSIGSLVPIPSKTFGTWKTAVTTRKSYLVYDLSTRKVVKRIRTSSEWTAVVFPTGKLGAVVREGNSTHFVDVETPLRDRETATEAEVLKYSLMAAPGYNVYYVIIPDKGHPNNFNILLLPADKLELLRTFNASREEIQLPQDVYAGTILLHNNDLPLFGGRKMKVLDFLSGETKQTFSLPWGVAPFLPASTLPGDFYLLHGYHDDKGILKYNPEEKEYSFVRHVKEGITLLLASKQQKRAMSEILDRLVRASGVGVPRELSTVIAGFI